MTAASIRCSLRARVGMVFQKPNPFPKSIATTWPTAPHPRSGAQPRRTGRDRREICCGAALWNEVKDRLNDPAPGFPAASSSGFASPAPSPPSPRSC